MRVIYLAGGCFWGVEEYFSRIHGVIDTEVGYANGNGENVTYEQVCQGTTGYAETVKISYNEQIITLKNLLENFWAVVDPTSINKQGPDVGTQYRSAIYYVDLTDLDMIQQSLNQEQLKYEKQIVTQIEPFKNFISAEDYHQDYLKKNPNGYCHIKLD